MFASPHTITVQEGVLHNLGAPGAMLCIVLVCPYPRLLCPEVFCTVSAPGAKCPAWLGVPLHSLLLFCTTLAPAAPRVLHGLVYLHTGPCRTEVLGTTLTPLAPCVLHDSVCLRARSLGAKVFCTPLTAPVAMCSAWLGVPGHMLVLHKGILHNVGAPGAMCSAWLGVPPRLLILYKSFLHNVGASAPCVLHGLVCPRARSLGIEALCAPGAMCSAWLGVPSGALVVPKRFALRLRTRRIVFCMVGCAFAHVTLAQVF